MWKLTAYGIIASMSKRSRRIAKRNEFKAVEDAIGSALGKAPRADAIEQAGAEARDPRIEKPLPRPKKKRESRTLRRSARQPRPEITVEAGKMSLKFRQVHVCRHVNPGQRKHWKGRAEAAAHIHERALVASLLGHLHLASRHRPRIAKRISQGPDRFSNRILEQSA